MDESKQPGIDFKSIILVDEYFNRLPNVPESCELQINVEHDWGGEEGNYVSEIKTKLSLLDADDGTERFVLNFTMVGLFSVNADSPNLKIEEYIKEFSPALMFPYIREHITLVSTKAGIKPILLPPTNFRALINETDKKRESEENL